MVQRLRGVERRFQHDEDRGGGDGEGRVDRCRRLRRRAGEVGRQRLSVDVSRNGSSSGSSRCSDTDPCPDDPSRLWLHNSGSGEFGYADLEAGCFEPVAFCPGYLRGLCFIGDYAVMGLSKPRENRTFTGLALDEALATRKAEARCALHVVDLRSGDTVHWLCIEGVVEELYDVVALPGACRPMAIGFRSDEIRRVISIA